MVFPTLVSGTSNGYINYITVSQNELNTNLRNACHLFSRKYCSRSEKYEAL